MEKNVKKTKINNRIDEYLIIQERKLAESLIQNQVNFDLEMKKKNRVADNFMKRFITNLNDPSFNLDDADVSTKDLELVEKSSFMRVQNSPTLESLEANYNSFKNFKENVLDKENDKSNSTLNIEVEKKVEKVPIVEPKVKNPQNFEKFSSFIYNNDTNKILAMIKDNSTISKNSNIFDRSNLSKLGILHYLSRRITYYCK